VVLVIRSHAAMCISPLSGLCCPLAGGAGYTAEPRSLTDTTKRGLPSMSCHSCVPSAHHPWRKNRYQQMKTPAFSSAW